MMTDSATASPSLHVEVLSLPEAMPGTVFSAIDVLQLAALVLKLRNRHVTPSLTWSVWVPQASPAMLTPAALAQLSSEPPLLAPVPERTLLVVPAVYAANALELPALAQKYPDVLARIAAHVQQGGALAVCATGLIFAAETGLLQQARLDAHWAFKSFFMRVVPQADFSASEAISVNGRLYSCVVPPAQSEMLIRVLHDCFDEEVAQSCARLLLFQPERQQMHSQQLSQQWLSRTADSPVFRAKQWLEMHVEQPYDLQELAAVASSSERTLLRHFRTVLGMSPLDYLHELRVQRAKVMLEISINSLQTIAHACGYANASTFSKLFRRATGISPGEYRQAHTLRTKRSRWRVETER